ncbi:AAA-domain-containing protein [Microstroma glucosiphilum]|uniref:AAA-domain-containing protein n=1 Tax=Pseudomicrostroma glucosiphilum TaxID=1684307 RepID=A0A316TZX8_9BASI|nr:AAA-domain-containing protein [Pseudomicrostroma glucosiphilum]PWN18178.1 AAA-domain-containing protein [Pseudomicrostroma glucosiphilum]
MDAGEPSFTTHQHQSSNYISSYNHNPYPFHPTEQQLPDPDADDHGLPPGLDPDFQDPFPTSVGSYSAQSAHHRGIDRHEALNKQEGSEQEDDPEEEPIVAASARTRTHLLPPAFSSDEDEDENGKRSESESEDDQDDDLVQDRRLEQQSPEKPRSGVKRLKIVLKPKPQSYNTIELNAQDRNAMVSTRGARPASSYSEAPVEDDDQPNGTGVAEGRRASGSGSRSTRHSARRAGQGVHENGGHESDDPLGAEIPPNDARALSDNQSDEDAVGEDDEDEELPQRPTRASRAAASSRPPSAARTTRSGRPTRSANYAEADEDEYDDKDGDSESESDEDGDHIGSSRSRGGGSQKRKNKSLEGFVVEDESNEESDREYGKSRRKSGGRLLRGSQSRVQALAAARARNSATNKGGASRRRSGRYSNLQSEEDDDDLITGDEDQPGYRLRERTKKVDYSLAAPPPEPLRDGMGRIVKRKSSNRSGANADTLGGAFELDARRAADLGLPHVGGAGGGRKGKTGWDALPLSMTGKDYAKAFGDEQDSSDDDIPASRKAPPPSLYGGGGSAGLLGSGPTPLGGAGGGGGAGAGNDGSARDALGRIKKGGDALADVDPLGVNMQVDFDSVGGLDGHIQQLKEMVSLPLLYPEVFTRFKVTPPRGVLFHGPPGTGKTLVARALAASCSTTGQQISFFMRKGADCLSKWVGEAERQLRMLFDEARASQPSIIFFDEIDGLAPVRSSKQDQIHASIVSTLLALMDGMDGRGQVVVIGATNRPDSVDPALRRPGRFDREFYFPLPSREARLSIINIHTKGWEPPLTDDFKDKLSEVTKGYGGADLRALCTEAALNAIQRRYPQIYQTTERLLLQPETIKVEAKDFMMSVNKLVPSSARSASSAAAPLAEHLKPILGDTVENATQALQKVLPPATKRNPLEEALWEDEPTAATFGSEDNGFGREMMLQTFESLRIFRPRLVIYGAEGMGQSFVGGALLHHLEGYHVQSLDVGALMGDSARTPEAAVVQLFVEAKRHKPSVIYIPGLVHWAHSVSDTVRATTKALLDELAASDPILLLAIAEAPLSELPSDVARWFGYLDNTKIEAGRPSDLQRQRFFEDLLGHVSKPPTDFPDAVPRRRRVLEELPKAPPRPPRQATAAELQQQVYDDQRTLEHLKYRLGPVLGELRKKFKKFTRDVWDEYNLHNLTDTYEWHKENGKVVVRLRYTKGFRRRRHSSVDEGFLISGGDGLTSSSQRQSQEATIEKPNGVVTFAEVNGSSTANQNDGTADVHMAEASTGLDGPEPTSAPSQQSVPAVLVHESQHTELNGTTTNGDNADGQASGADAAGDSSDREYDYRDMPIWTMNLERMQRRLYHNGYLTIGNFLDDLDKIVANAEQAQEVDMERMVRAHQMRNLAVVLLEQYIDINFRVECEGMAGRQLAREKEKREAEEAAKKSVEEARAAGKNPEPPRRPSGERFSARVQGQQPEHRHPVDVSAIERNSGKRSRTSSARNSGIEGSERKRARSALMNEVDQMVAQGQLGNAGDAADKVTESQTTNGNAADPLGQPTEDVVEAVSGLGPVVVPSQTSTVAHTNGESVAAGAEPLGTQDAASLSVPSEPLALQAHPPFVCPPLELDHLRNHLLAASKMFNIDQLLQLRAACFDGVWKRRADWDRSAMIQELEGLADKVEKAVRLELEAEGR